MTHCLHEAQILATYATLSHRLICPLDTLPSPTENTSINISWWKVDYSPGGVEIASHEMYHMLATPTMNNTQFTMHNLQLDDTGCYVCKINGNFIAQVQLIVNGKFLHPMSTYESS